MLPSSHLLNFTLLYFYTLFRGRNVLTPKVPPPSPNSFGRVSGLLWTKNVRCNVLQPVNTGVVGSAFTWQHRASRTRENGISWTTHVDWQCAQWHITWHEGTGWRCRRRVPETRRRGWQRQDGARGQPSQSEYWFTSQHVRLQLLFMHWSLFASEKFVLSYLLPTTMVLYLPVSESRRPVGVEP